MIEWLVRLRPTDDFARDGSCDVVEVVEADFVWEANRAALETRNIPSNWRVMESERA